VMWRGSWDGIHLDFHLPHQGGGDLSAHGLSGSVAFKVAPARRRLGRS
jgi:hypothetical protein